VKSFKSVEVNGGYPTLADKVPTFNKAAFLWAIEHGDDYGDE
jgi:hypothetical protein